MKRRPWIGLIALAVISWGCLGASAVRAEVVFGNLGQNGTAAISDDLNALITSSNWRAHGFLVGGSNRILQSVVLGLESDVAITARVQIFASGTGSLPTGALPAGTALGTATQQVTTDSATLYTFSFPNLALDIGSSYWAVVSAQSAGNLSWSFNNAELSPSEQNSSGWTFTGTVRSTNAGTSWPDYNVSGTQTTPSMSISAVPEPSTYVLGITALALCGIAASRRRRAIAECSDRAYASWQ